MMIGAVWVFAAYTYFAGPPPNLYLQLIAPVFGLLFIASGLRDLTRKDGNEDA
jgi:hypothetical protein